MERLLSQLDYIPVPNLNCSECMLAYDQCECIPNLWKNEEQPYCFLCKCIPELLNNK